jgi:hypothetical protein
MMYSKLARGWSYARKLADSDWEVLALILAITGVALLLRLVNLTTLPTGLHGDEAIVGMEGQRILREGWIDPYSPSARGQPTAPFYLAAITVWIDGIAASIASMIAMAGDEVVMPENAMLMLHDPSGVVMGTAQDMREDRCEEVALRPEVAVDRRDRHAGLARDRGNRHACDAASHHADGGLEDAGPRKRPALVHRTFTRPPRFACSAGS